MNDTKQAFDLTTDDKKEDMKNLIVHCSKEQVNEVGKIDYEGLLEAIEKKPNKVYRKQPNNSGYDGILKEKIKEEKDNKTNKAKFDEIQNYFSKGQEDIREVIKKVVSTQETGHFIVIDTSLKGIDSDKYQALFLNRIEKSLIEQSEEHYSSGGKLPNALVVMDEAS